MPCPVCKQETECFSDCRIGTANRKAATAVPKVIVFVNGVKLLDREGKQVEFECPQLGRFITDFPAEHTEVILGFVDEAGKLQGVAHARTR